MKTGPNWSTLTFTGYAHARDCNTLWMNIVWHYGACAAHSLSICFVCQFPTVHTEYTAPVHCICHTLNADDTCRENNNNNNNYYYYNYYFYLLKTYFFSLLSIALKFGQVWAFAWHHFLSAVSKSIPWCKERSNIQ